MSVWVERPVLWGDCDVLQHVNNTVYIRWFEDARIEFFADVGIECSEPSSTGPILRDVHCMFLAPVVFPNTVRIECHVGQIRNTSFELGYTAFLGTQRVATGTSVVVMVDYASSTKIPLTDALRGSLQRHQQDDDRS